MPYNYPMEKTTPTFWRILDTDYISTFSWVSVATVWGLLIIFKLLSWNFRDETFYLIFSGVVTLIAGVLILWRQIAVRRIFNIGVEMRGKVVKTFFYRDRGRITVEYTPKGARDKVRSVSNLHNVRRTRKLKEGDFVSLLVDPDRPSHTLIKEAYLD
jgi:hypothetical protein